MEMASASRNMNIKSILAGSIFCLIIILANATAFQLNSSSYISKVTGTSEGDRNISSSSYKTYLVAGDFAGNISSTQYKTGLGWRYELVSASSDVDGDGIPDAQDTLIGNLSLVNTSGVSALNATIDSLPLNGTFNGTHQLVLYDGSTLLLNFSHNFSNGTIDMRKINITITASSIVVNLGGQLAIGESKTLYLTDASFTSLCAKDAVLASGSEITSACTGSSEYNLDSCLGNSNGVRIGPLLCTDRGSFIEVSNLTHSGLKGTATSSSGSSGSSGGAGGGGGGGGTTTAQSSSITVLPTELIFSMNPGISLERTLQITNTGTKSHLIHINVKGKELEKILTIKKNLTLAAGEKTFLTLHFAEVQKGPIIGTLVLIADESHKEIPVIIDVQTENFLFDAKIKIPDEQRKIHAGEKLQAQVHLLQVGPQKRVDVTVKYTLKDLEDRFYFNDSETFFVLANKEYTKQIATDYLPPGKYVLSMEVSYPNALATSSAMFEIIEGPQSKKSSSFNVSQTFLWMIGVLTFLILLVSLFFLLRKKHKRRKKR